jgi:hypothetical protein
VTFDENAGKTLLVVHDLYPSKERLDAAVASGSTCGMPETLETTFPSGWEPAP